MDKAQLLVDIFALYASFTSKDYFATRAYARFGDMGDSESECPSTEDEFGSTFLSTSKTTPKPVHISPPILPDVEMTPVDQIVTPETFRKKDKQRRVLQKNTKKVMTSESKSETLLYMTFRIPGTLKKS
ncbi:hypothetical protein RhiirA5_376585 [Rhizophagus irregularis]|uniref:Uncharacterized protein n=1 Tax=Rhizophagus irregularis TaxID=588596 RepID=A0A2N0PMG7_9GLOM|nr:hypothetical protein RhiirA5_376585 [Rhizophagus irregularis]